MICSLESLREAPVLVNHPQPVKRNLLKRQIVDVFPYIAFPSCRICAPKCADICRYTFFVLFSLCLRNDFTEGYTYKTSGLERSGLKRSRDKRSALERSDLERSDLERSDLERSGSERSGVQKIWSTKGLAETCG